MSKSNKLILWTLIAALLVCGLLMVFALSTQDDVTNMQKTQTQNAVEREWDRELHLTLTAEAK